MMDREVLPVSTVERSNQSSSNTFDFLDETLLEDITVTIDGQSFLTNRFILSANSFYFREILNKKPKVNTVEITDVDAAAFDSVLNFFGTGQWKEPSSAKLNSMLVTLKTLKLVNYEKVITDYMVTCVSVESFYNIWYAAKQMDQKETEKEIAKFVAKNMESCSKSEDFSLLSLQQVISILASSDLKEMPCRAILQCVARWCQAAPEKRRKYIPSLVTIMRMQFGEENFCSNLDMLAVLSEASHIYSSEAPIEQQTKSLHPEVIQSKISADLDCPPCGDGDSRNSTASLMSQPHEVVNSPIFQTSESSSTDGVAVVASPPCGGEDSERTDTPLVSSLTTDVQEDPTNLHNKDTELSEISC